MTEILSHGAVLIGLIASAFVLVEMQRDWAHWVHVGNYLLAVGAIVLGLRLTVVVDG